MEYRPLADEDRDAMERIHDYAFYPESGPGDPDGEGATDDEAIDDEASFGEPRALYEDGEVASVCRLLTFDATLRGETREFGGLRGVATPPTHRRRGRGRRVIAESLAEFRDREIPFVALWPFDDGFYEELGWATCTAFATYECPPASFAPIAARERGTVRRLSADDWIALDRAYSAARAGETLAMERSERWWRHRVLGGDGGRYSYGWERDGSIAGYVVYSVSDGEAGRVLRVTDLAAVDDEALRHLCGFLADHDSQVETIDLRRRRDATLLDRLGDPDEVTCTLERGPMVRIADLETALDRTPVPEDLEAELVVRVRDDFAEWNDGTVAVRFADGTASCEDAPDHRPDAAVDVGMLSQLLVGYRSVDSAARTGDLDVTADDALATLRRGFPTTTVELREFF